MIPNVRDAVIAHAAECRKAIAAGKPRPGWVGEALTNADLSGANLSGAYLTDANLDGANLSGANLSGANLSGANLSGAYLTDANLSGANLSGAYLSGANLTDANLSGANLSGAYLSGANLRDANLYGADLRGANLYGADLRGAKGAISAGPVGATGRIIYAVAHPDGPRFQAGCFWGTEVELRAAIKARYADGSGLEQHRATYIAAVDFIAAALAVKL